MMTQESASPMLRALLFSLLSLTAFSVHARGASPYIVVGLSPEIERAIERVLILADDPVLTRPIPAARVLDALPRACERDEALCAEVRRYLNGMTKTIGISHLSAAVGTSGGDSVPRLADGSIDTQARATALPNRHGMAYDSAYEISGRLYIQRSDYALLNVGFAAHEDEFTPTGTLMSIGTQYVQVDIGWRDHWLSPMSDSAMLLSTQADTMPSITVSNYTPISRVNLRYQVFFAKMSESSRIGFDGGFTTGEPRLAGLHFSIEPLPGWSIGVNRLMQYGGGERGQDSIGDLFDALFRPSEYDNTGTTADFGNQVASITSSFTVSTGVPFAVYFEYAGEDTSMSSDVRLGNSALSAGLRFPRLGRLGNFDVTFEASEWQNSWYVHHIYQDGLVNEGRVLGHWGADWRVRRDGVGGRSLMGRVNWQRPNGMQVEGTARWLDNESYGVGEYDAAHLLEVRASWRLNEDFRFGGELNVGRDVFGESFSRVSAFLRF